VSLLALALAHLVVGAAILGSFYWPRRHGEPERESCPPWLRAAAFKPRLTRLNPALLSRVG
jgi:hypothetical protein